MSKARAAKKPMAKQAAVEKVQDQVRVIVDGVESRAEAVKDRALELKNDAMTRGGALVKRAGEIIKAHPLKAVGLAFGAGYFGARILRG